MTDNGINGQQKASYLHALLQNLMMLNRQHICQQMCKFCALVWTKCRRNGQWDCFCGIFMWKWTALAVYFSVLRRNTIREGNKRERLFDKNLSRRRFATEHKPL